MMMEQDKWLTKQRILKDMNFPCVMNNKETGQVNMSAPRFNGV